VNHPVVLRTLTSEAKILIGERVGISGGSVCSAKEILIGNGCLIGADVLIADTDFHPLRSSERYDSQKAFAEAKPVQIMDNVFIGARVIVLKGVTIGDGSVIGAGSVVTQDIPAGCIAAGNPCRVIRANL
jgi:acetyltransferase-like isoleucine patch superfamily enzyme